MSVPLEPLALATVVAAAVLVGVVVVLAAGALARRWGGSPVAPTPGERYTCTVCESSFATPAAAREHAIDAHAAIDELTWSDVVTEGR